MMPPYTLYKYTITHKDCDKEYFTSMTDVVEAAFHEITSHDHLTLYNEEFGSCRGYAAGIWMSWRREPIK